MEEKQQIKIELTPEVASGVYSNLAIIAHSGNEFFLDFIAMTPNGQAQSAKVQSRVVMTPENAKNLLFALRDNLTQYEQVFGEIERKTPKGQAPGNTFKA